MEFVLHIKPSHVRISASTYFENAKGGPHSTMDSVLALHPAALLSILDFPEIVTLDVGEIYGWQTCTTRLRCLHSE